VTAEPNVCNTDCVVWPPDRLGPRQIAWSRQGRTYPWKQRVPFQNCSRRGRRSGSGEAQGSRCC